MKFATSLALTASAAQLVLAQPHGHGHHHFHKKHLQTLNLVKRDTATVYVNEDGEVLSVQEVCAGLAANKFVFRDHVPPEDLCHGWDSEAESDDQSADEVDPAEGHVFTEVKQDDDGGDDDKDDDKDDEKSEDDQDQDSDESGSSGDASVAEGVDREFPDGEIDCDSFPSEYGALPVEWLDLGGWSGIQQVEIANNAVQDMRTAIAGETCTDGAMCSYACPPGYLKSQWPATQGATGQSVGGLECSKGKLHLTNPGLSTKLCIPGTGGVTAKNKADDVVSICRTDYPGTESETIPLSLEPGEEQELACPEAKTYYEWDGNPTSAQYYLNPIGVPQDEACQWGEAGIDVGNWAPINLGVGRKDGKTWLSIFQNMPTTDAIYEGKVEIKGDIVGSCKYENGKYCGDTGCNKQGCTVASESGEATYVIS